MNHRNRTGAFVLILLALGSHMLDGRHGLLAWALLALSFLGYPQLAYLRGRRATDPMAAEMQHMMCDALLFGAYAGVLAFPLWITFILLVGGVVNLTAFRGLRGGVTALVVFSVGAFAGSATTGFAVSLPTRWPTTLLSMICIIVYLLIMAHAAYARALKLNVARNELLATEKAMQQRLDEISALQAQLSDSANRDALTGLYNRRYLSSTLAREVARSQREGVALAALMLDVDHFKRVNDEFGHPGGDEVLRQIGQLLVHTVRASDIACRYGGEEFLILMPGMSARQAAERADNYRLQFAAHRTEFAGRDIRITVSIGVAVLPQHGHDGEALIAAADQALYRAKSAGRNCVDVCP